ncbi:dihydrofolate synthase / folylpolyglutamate synthase [Sesbania bispinosa]|nr:dihydrofolate synthase / folylpolyglutamate synthase [Sesbania bispinosa]
MVNLVTKSALSRSLHPWWSFDPQPPISVLLHREVLPARSYRSSCNDNNPHSDSKSNLEEGSSPTPWRDYTPS